MDEEEGKIKMDGRVWTSKSTCIVTWLPNSSPFCTRIPVDFKVYLHSYLVADQSIILHAYMRTLKSTLDSYLAAEQSIILHMLTCGP